jgi:hypothetical protein
LPVNNSIKIHYRKSNKIPADDTFPNIECSQDRLVAKTHT